MQACSTSINSSEILMREPFRNDIARKVSEFLERNSITVLSTRTTGISEKALTFNSIIAVVPNKRAHVAAEKERLESTIKELSFIEIDGVTLIRSAYEVAKIMRTRGYKMRAQSVQRIAKGIGISLVK